MPFVDSSTMGAEKYAPPDSFIALFATVGALCVVYLLVSYFAVLTKNERIYFRKQIQSLPVGKASSADGKS